MVKAANLKEKLTGIRLAVNTAVVGSIIAINNKLFFAEDDVTKFLGKSGKSNDSFKKLDETVQKTGNSFYSLLRTIGIIGLVVSIISLGISLAVSKNATKREENKTHAMFVCLGGIIMFGVLSLVSILNGIGSKI